MLDQADTPSAGPERKRHHFVPVAYLNGWTDKAGMVNAHFADQSGTVRSSRPEAIGFERYYYSIDLPDGSRDNDSFEEMFGRVETLWPKVVAALDARAFDREALDAMYRMMGFMRVRGPAARDYNESLDLLTQRTSLKILAEIGKLPAKLDRYRDELDTVEMTINRQRTLAKINDDLLRFADLLHRVGFEIVVNATAFSFITSDNPVAYFAASDTRIDEPYFEARDLEIWFPLSPNYILHGSHTLRAEGHIPGFRSVSDEATIATINETTARFAYRLVFAADRSQDDLITPHLATSPILRSEVVRLPSEVQFHIGHQFGPRPKLIKFRPELCEGDLTEADFDLS